MSIYRKHFSQAPMASTVNYLVEIPKKKTINKAILGVPAVRSCIPLPAFPIENIENGNSQSYLMYIYHHIYNGFNTLIFESRPPHNCPAARNGHKHTPYQYPERQRIKPSIRYPLKSAHSRG